jgi:hypothetical protein
MLTSERLQIELHILVPCDCLIPLSYLSCLSGNSVLLSLFYGNSHFVVMPLIIYLFFLNTPMYYTPFIYYFSKVERIPFPIKNAFVTSLNFSSQTTLYIVQTLFLNTTDDLMSYSNTILQISLCFSHYRYYYLFIL